MSILAWIGARARWIMAAGVVAALFMPAVSALLRPFLPAFVVLVFQWRINRSQLERILSVLPREERIIIKILLDNKNRLEQNHIVALSGINKVGVSRVITRLEQRGVVEKKPLGNTNLIILRL